MPPVLYPLVAVLFWGLNFVLLKVLVAAIPPHQMNAVRTLVAAAGFLILARGAGLGQVARRDAVRIVAYGLVGNALFQWLLIEGVLRSPAAVAAVANATNPAWLALVAYLWLGERLGAGGYLGIALAGVGVALLGAGGGRGEVGFGVFLLVLASLAWAVYSVSAKLMEGRYPLLTWVALGYVGGMVPYWLWELPGMARVDLAAVPAWAWLGTAASGLLANLVAYLAWMRGVQLLGAARAGVWQNLAPVVGALGGYLFLGERLSPLAWAGGALVLAGVYLTQRSRPRGRRGS